MISFSDRFSTTMSSQVKFVSANFTVVSKTPRMVNLEPGVAPSRFK